MGGHRCQFQLAFGQLSSQVVRRQKLMLRMMEAMGVNVPDAMRMDGGLAFLEAQAKCRFCGNEDSCRTRWIR